MDKLDLSLPLEAVNILTDEVVPVRHVGGVIGSHIKVAPVLGAGWSGFNWDGSKQYRDCPWFIRNTAKPSTPSNEELTQRMEKAVRDLAARMQDNGTINLYEIQKAGREAQAIVSDLPKPVDPDLLIARKLAHEAHGGTTAEFLDGQRDDSAGVQWRLEGIKAGRTLAAGGTAHE